MDIYNYYIYKILKNCEKYINNFFHLKKIILQNRYNYIN